MLVVRVVVVGVGFEEVALVEVLVVGVDLRAAVARGEHLHAEVLPSGELRGARVLEPVVDRVGCDGIVFPVDRVGCKCELALAAEACTVALGDVAVLCGPLVLGALADDDRGVVGVCQFGAPAVSVVDLPFHVAERHDLVPREGLHG